MAVVMIPTITTAAQWIASKDATAIDMTDEVAEAATEYAYECERCGAGCADLHPINLDGGYFLIECAVCGHADLYDK